MASNSLFKLRKYTHEWIKDFYVQSDIWWGADAGENYYASRINYIEQLCGQGNKRILELGAGSGGVAAQLAKLGHDVTAVELTDAIQLAQQADRTGWLGTLTALEDDFYTVQLEGKFDVICYWDGFGVGTDQDQQLLLHRIGKEWLAQDGSVLIDVFCPFRFARHAGESEILPPLKGVPGSVEMNHKTHFDPLNCRWIDGWEPTAAPEQALAQTVRCYSPMDFILLLQGSGLEITYMDVGGKALDFQSNMLMLSGDLMDTWSYLVQLKHV